MHCGRVHCSLLIQAQVVDPYRLKSKGHKGIRGGEANQDTLNAMERVTVIVKAGRQLRHAELSEVVKEAERWELDKVWARFF
jgi:hypothetical protein